MSERRPYDAGQLERLTEHMLDEGSATVAAPLPNLSDREPLPDDAERLPVADPDVYPSAFTELRTAVGGLGHRFTRKGQAEREIAAEDRQAVVAEVASRITNPRRTDDPNEKTGWVGTHKREVEVDTPEAGAEGAGGEEPPEDFSKLGANLFSPGGPGRPKARIPNPLRPATHSEIAADRRVERKFQKARRARNKARWLHNSYPGQLSADPRYRLSRGERRHMRYTARQARKLERRENVAKTKMNMVVDTESMSAYRLRAAGYDIRRNATRAYEAARMPEALDAARALGDEIIDRHYESWDLTREQAERLAAASARIGGLVVDETVATTQTAVKGGKYIAEFYADVARGAADIYWQAAKRATQGTAKGVRKLYRAARPEK